MKPVAWIIGGVVLLALLQLFARYDYVHLAGGNVMRIDRLASTSCYMPCQPTPPPPTGTPFDANAAGADYAQSSDSQDQDAILIAKGTPLAAQLVSTEGPKYSWSAHPSDTNAQYALAAIAKGNDPWASPAPNSLFTPDTPPPVTSAKFQTKYVCFCDSKGAGWSWEVHLDSRAVYYIDDNADLMKKYGLVKR